MTPEEQADRDMREVPTLTDLVVGEMKARDWLVFRVRQGRAGWNLGSGIPDLFAIRGERSLFVELKMEEAALGPKQIIWREAILDAGLAYYLWRPSDWRLGRIQQVLA